MRKWENTFSASNNILHQKLKWCPKCLQDMRKSKQVIFEPLIWSIHYVEICPKHRIKLNQECFSCTKTPKTFTVKFRPGYCTHCVKWLGEENQGINEVKGTELDRQLMICNEVGVLLSRNNDKTPTITADEITLTIKKIIEIVTNGNVKEFSEIIHRNRVSVISWRLGKRKPDLETLIDISKAVNIKVVDLLLNRIDYSALKINQIPYLQVKREPRVEREYDAIKMHLEYIYLNEYPPPSVSEIKRRLNYNKIRDKFPELCKKISQKYSDYKKTQYEINLMQKIEEVKAIMYEMYNKSEFPTQNAVRNRMKNPVDYWNPEVIETYWAILKELGLK